MAVRAWVLLLLALSFALVPFARSQQPASDLLLTTGVTTQSPAGKPLAYVAWNSANPALLQARQFAVYTKPGGPDAPAPFERRVVVTPALTTDDAAASLALAAALRPDSPELEPILRAVASAAGVPAGANPASTLAKLIATAAANPSARTDVELLASTQPAVALALGRAWSGEIAPGLNTVEVREWNPVLQRDFRVVGRVILDTASPALLPPPGPPRQVPDTTPSGSLRIRLRWATSAELRQRTPLQTGFNVWRMTSFTAETHGLLSRAPSLAELQSLATRVNELPIVAAKVFDDANVANFAADPVTSFLNDDNGHFESGAPAFTDGTEFAYFVTARDALGRDGVPSPAGLGTACLTLPLAVPLHAEVSNALQPKAAKAVQQTLDIAWDADTNAPPALPDAYEVYRGLDASDWRPADPPAALRVAVVNHEENASRLAWSDTTLAADPASAGRTFWYALRAVRNTRCGPVYSPLSPPIRATFRDFTAPDAPTGGVLENCPRVSVVYTDTTQAALAPGDPAVLLDSDGIRLRRHRVEIQRRGHGVAWSRIVASDSLGILLDSGVVWFAPDEEKLAFDFNRRLVAGAGAIVQIECRAGTESGRAFSAFHNERRSDEIIVTRFLSAEISLEDLDSADALSRPWLLGASPDSDPVCNNVQKRGEVGPDGVFELFGSLQPAVAYVVNEVQANGRRRVGVFVAEQAHGLPNGVGVLFVRDPELLARGPNAPFPQYCVLRVNDDFDETQTPRPCTHEAFPSGTDQIVGPRLQVEFDARTSEYRVYRRVDDGPLTLIAQGPLEPDTKNPSRRRRVYRRDTSMPDAGGTICYFAQAVDPNGNASPLTPLGCVPIPPRSLPVPVLSRPQAAGDSAHPTVELHWACPPAGVGRFEVFVQREKSTNTFAGLAGIGPAKSASAITALTGVAEGVHRVRDSFGQLIVASIPRDRLFTDAVGSAGMGDGPQFSLRLDVEEGATYLLFIKSVAPGPLLTAKRSDASFAYKFTWRTPANAAPGLVPWPQRSLPPVGKFNPDIVAMQMPGFVRLWQTNVDESPVGVRIGRLPAFARDSTDRSVPAPADHYVIATLPKTLSIDAADPNLGLFRELAGASPRTNLIVLPVVLYRQQVANARFPKVSGTVTQVSPMVRQLTWEVSTVNADLRAAFLLDPFIAVTRHVVNGDVAGGPPDVWLLDTHPVTTGAHYRYWLVRFAPNGEPDLTIPAGEVEIQ